MFNFILINLFKIKNLICKIKKERDFIFMFLFFFMIASQVFKQCIFFKTRQTLDMPYPILSWLKVKGNKT